MIMVSFAAISTLVSVGLACDPVSFGKDRVACKCDANQCDTLDFEWPQSGKYVQVVSSKAGDRFKVTHGINKSNNIEADYVVKINAEDKRGKVIGYGGAVTDSAASLTLNLTEQASQRLFDSYFAANGLDYNMLRVPIGGSDFSTHKYTYDDLPDGQEDLELEKFKLQPEDLEYKIPFIKKVNSIRKQRGLDAAKLFAVSWSPPAWMKNNSDIVGGELKGDYEGPYFKAYAKYITRFIDEYKEHGIDTWGITAQNEPIAGSLVTFNSMSWQPKPLADFNEFNLIPTIRTAGYGPDDLHVFLYEDSLGFSKSDDYKNEFLSRSELIKNVSGYSRHWYLAQNMTYELLKSSTSNLPSNFVLGSTESSIMSKPVIGDWDRGEKYARDILEALLAGFNFYMDWNLVLDPEGGPTWIKNYLDAPIIVDQEKQIFYKNPIYYAIGHVSRFIKTGSTVLGIQLIEYNSTSTEHISSPDEGDKTHPVIVAAELEPEANDAQGRKLAVVVVNRQDKQVSVKLQFTKCSAQEDPLGLDLAPSSITSLALNC